MKKITFNLHNPMSLNISKYGEINTYQKSDVRFTRGGGAGVDVKLVGAKKGKACLQNLNFM